MNTAHPDELEVLVSDLAVLVRKIQGQVPLIDELTTTRQTGSPFVAAGTKRIMGEQYAKDKRAHRVAQIAGLPAGNGVTRAPGNLPGWALSAEYSMTLRDQIRRIVRHHQRNGTHGRGFITVFGPMPEAEANALVLARYLYELVWTIDGTGLARGVTSDLTHLHRNGHVFLNGEPRRALPGPCPFCGNHSLVHYVESDAIFCERSRNPDGTRPACHCLDAGCPCRSDRAFRHSWLSGVPRSSPRHWNALQRHLANHKESS